MKKVLSLTWHTCVRESDCPGQAYPKTSAKCHEWSPVIPVYGLQSQSECAMLIYN